jgi:ribosomal protein S4E
MNYYQKYLKYKSKYVTLKKNQLGGLIVGDLIIHDGRYVEVVEIHGKKNVVVRYIDATNTEVQQIIPMIAAEEGERLMKKAIQQTAPVGSIFALKADPSKLVYITENQFNSRVTFEKIDKIENPGKPNEKLVFDQDGSKWSLHMESFLQRYQRLK